MKSIDSLLDDIGSMFDPEHQHSIDEKNFLLFVEHITGSIYEALESPDKGRDNKLRLSKTGTPDRKLWYESQEASGASTKFNLNDSPTFVRFLQGHLTEALLLFLAREAGHTVEYEQLTVDVLGVPGHLDAVIDGHLVDVKTASQFGFSKFKDRDRLVNGDDPFGYISQLSAYKKGLQNKNIELKEPSYIWAYNKSNSEQVLVPVEEFYIIDAEKRIERQKEVQILENVDSLPYCYEDEPHGKSGNMQVSKQCTYCPFLQRCRKDVRTFGYSNGPVYLTKIVNQPKVKEL